jgi:hypothetical protein
MNQLLSTDVTQCEEIDGYIVSEDGEILGLAEKPEFHVTDEDSAEWVLRKMQDADTILAGLEARERAILANLKRLKDEQQRRRNFLEFRFGKELEQFTRQQLAGKRSKTWTTPYGSVAFHKTQGSVRILNMQTTIEWARKIGLADKVRVKEEILASDLKEAVLSNPTPVDTFEVKFPGERCTITTGVKE